MSDELHDEQEVRARLRPRGARVDLVPGGPALVRGAATVADDAGHEHPTTRPLVGVCVCGLSQRPPWCDATHKVRGGP